MTPAYAIGTKLKAAYSRDALFEKRRKLMEAWACSAPSEAST